MLAAACTRHSQQLQLLPGCVQGCHAALMLLCWPGARFYGGTLSSSLFLILLAYSHGGTGGPLAPAAVPAVAL